MKNKAIPFLVAGMIVIILNTVLDLTTGFPHGVRIDLTILSLVLVAVGVLLWRKAKRGNNEK